MTTYTTIPDADIDQDSPVTQPLVTALRDNPIAIAEGAAGAPKVVAGALAGTFLGSFDGGDGVWAGLSDLDDIEGIYLCGAARVITTSSVSGTISIRFSDDNGETWSAATTILSEATGQFYSVENLNVNLVTGNYAFQVNANITSGTATLPSGSVNAFQINANGTLSTNGCGLLAYATKGKST